MSNIIAAVIIFVILMLMLGALSIVALYTIAGALALLANGEDEE